MRTKLFMLASLMLAAVALTGCSSDEDVALIPEEPQVEEPKTPKDAEEPTEEPVVSNIIELSAAQKTAVQKNNKFAFNLFRAISQSEGNKGKSLMVSPLSLTYVLGMANAGATGRTSEEITRLLGFGEGDKEAVNELCKRLIVDAPKVDGLVDLTVANCVAADKSVLLSDDYRQTLDGYYGAESAMLQFGTREAVDYVNNWCREHTGGMIPRIIDRLDGVMALMNAVYFKASWSGAFDPAETKEEPFLRENGSEVALPMMHREDAAFYWGRKGLGFSTLGLKYGEGKNWTMFILLPDEGVSVDDVVGRLNAEAWSNVASQYHPEEDFNVEVDVKLPRFKADTETDLRPVLESMGAGSMFVPRGEFSLISDNYKDLSVSLIKQKAAIEVSEEGTEASAMTIGYWAGADDKNAGPTPIPVFHATRPFIYLIQEATTGAIFFMGTYRGE